jgi:hypothetical protein
MLAKLADALPEGDWLYEPKWDGFRAIVFRGVDDCLHPEPRPAAARPLFPGAARGAGAPACRGCVVDGEIVIARRRTRLRRLQLRLHPAASRVAKLARDAGLVRRVRSAGGAGDDLRASRRPSDAERLERCCRGRRADPPDADDARPRWRPSGCSASRAPGSTA